MKNLKASVLLSALFLSMPFLAAHSFAESNSDYRINNDSPEQCGYYYRQVLRQPLTVSESAVTIDKEKAAEIETMRKMVDEQVMPANIADLPSYGEWAEYDNGNQAHQVLKNSDGLTENDARDHLKYLVAAYYFGEYVPKDDYQASRYLRKLLSHYQQVAPEQAEIVVMSIFSYLGDVGASDVSSDNPTWKKDNTEAVFKLLIQAGSLETEALLIEDDYNSSDDSCEKNMLPRLKALAEQGSRIAIHKMADIYTNYSDLENTEYEEEVSSTKELNEKKTHALLFDEPDEKGSYWRQKAKENPLAQYEGGF